MKYCDGCKYLSLTERQQKARKLNHIDHMCTLLDKRVMHLGQHPRLPRLDDCPLEEVEYEKINC
jgi:hypothetical protein